jgi:hypothetical protein
MKSLKLAALMAASLGVVGSASAILSLDGSFGVTDAHYQRLSQQSPFASVGSFDYSEGGSSFSATGTLIAPDWVLTAGHNFSTAGGVTGTFNIGALQSSFSSTSIFFHPSWAGSPNVGPTQGADIALVRLNAPITGIAPSRVASAGNFVGLTSVTVGYGAWGDGTAASNPGDGNKRAMMNRIDRQYATPFNGNGPQGGILVTDFDNTNANRNTLDRANVLANDPGFSLYNQSYSNLSDTFLPDGQTSAAGFGGLPTARDVFGDSELPEVWMEGSTGQGDSGGPTFANLEGEWQIIGVTSWGENPVYADEAWRTQGRYGDLSVLVDATQHAAWIDATVPEPSSLAVIGLGALALLRRKRQPKAS